MSDESMRILHNMEISTKKVRLIDANALMARKPFCIFKSAAMSSYNDGYLACADKAREAIALAPTVDAVEVVHGHWVSLTECANAGVYCSVCNKKVYKEDYAWCNRKNKLRSNYCPNCGAKMDGLGEEL